MENGHAHANAIKQWVAAVDNKYKDFSLRMDKYRNQLEDSLGIQAETEFRQDLSIDRNSDSSLDNKVKEPSSKDLKELNEEKRRSARRKEWVLIDATFDCLLRLFDFPLQFYYATKDGFPFNVSLIFSFWSLFILFYLFFTNKFLILFTILFIYLFFLFLVIFYWKIICSLH